MQDILFQKTGQRVNFRDGAKGAATTTVGNTSRFLFYNDDAREEFVKCAPRTHRRNVRIFLTNMSIILRIISSEKRKIKVDMFAELCMTTSLFFFT